MPYAAPDNFSFRPYIFPPLVGGYTFTQGTDAECVTYSNIDMMRDKFVRPRRGAQICHTPGVLGSAQFAGLSICAVGTLAAPLRNLLIMPKMGSTTFYYTDLDKFNMPAGGFTTLDTSTLPQAPPAAPPASPMDVNVVQMVPASDAAGNSIVLMAHGSWPKIVKWDGTAAPATNIAASPVTPYIVYHTDNRVWAISQDRKNLRFSEPGDVDTWPVSNDIGVIGTFGAIMALYSAPDKLIIFCRYGILSLTGNPDDDNVRINIEHPNIGLTQPTSLAYFGNTAFFVFNGSVYQYSGTVSLVSDAIRTFFQDQPRYPAALSDLSYVVRMPTISGTGSTAVMFDRAHFGNWTLWEYPSTTGVGAGANTNPAVAFFGTNYFLAGSDGNVYSQEHWNITNANRGGPASPDPPFAIVPDYNARPVKVSVETKAVDMGDDLLTKAWRTVRLYGLGTNVNVTLNLFDSTGTIVSVSMLTGGTLPCELNTPSVDGTSASPVTEFNRASLTITGDYLLLKRAEIWWRPVRYGQISYSQS